MAQEVVVNYETLFELLRREKNREELQQLPENFLVEVKKYLNEKKQTTLTRSDDPFSEIEQEKTQRQLANIKKILREIYERREKKIISMALNKSRIPNSAIDSSILLPEEKKLYEHLIEVFNRARNEILLSYLNADYAKEEQKEGAEAKIEVKEENPAPAQNQDFQQAYDIKTVKFVIDTIQFVGPNLELYGPYSKDETANLPLEVCNVLINKDKAVFCENSQS